MLLRNKSSLHSMADNKHLFFLLMWLACIRAGLGVLVSEYGLPVLGSRPWESSALLHVSDSGAQAEGAAAL